ncbi:MAG: hypothetical protein R2939_12010 [Kofleriaceae bacterium]
MPGGAAQHGGGEGSGLIDIRSMASAYLGDRAKGSTAAPPMGSIGSVDDLPVFTATAFNEPAVLIPTAGSRGGNNKLLYGLIAGVGALALIAVVLVILVLKGGDKKVVIAAAPPAGEERQRRASATTSPRSISISPPATMAATAPARPRSRPSTRPPRSRRRSRPRSPPRSRRRS